MPDRCLIDLVEDALGHRRLYHRDVLAKAPSLEHDFAIDGRLRLLLIYEKGLQLLLLLLLLLLLITILDRVVSLQEGNRFESGATSLGGRGGHPMLR